MIQILYQWHTNLIQDYTNQDKLIPLIFLSVYWCFWTVVLEKTLESPLDSKEIKTINTKGSIFYFSPNNFIYLFINFWLCWIFIAAQAFL